MRSRAESDDWALAREPLTWVFTVGVLVQFALPVGAGETVRGPVLMVFVVLGAAVAWRKG